MKYNNAIIFVQFQELGENLAEAGQYTSASPTEKSKTIQLPRYSYSFKSLTLGPEFIRPLLDRKTYEDPDPKKRFHIPWLRRNREIYFKFKTMTPEQLIHEGVRNLVFDLEGDVNSVRYEIF